MGKKEEQFMRTAFQLAEKGNGYVNPNPKVGCLIVYQGEIISKGWHKKFGEKHAEINAIENALASGFDKFDESEIYITLEPCSHYGKTPPCAPVIADKKFKRAIIAMKDPNPEVAGKGIKILEDSGIEVLLGILENEAAWQNRIFTKYITENKPYIILKVGQTLDGHIATKRGQSKWITSEESRLLAQKLRTEVDGILIGKMTASTDNPQLNVRDIPGRDPRRIIVDSNLSLPLDLNVYKDANRKETIICCSKKACTYRKAETLQLAGVTLQECELNDIGKIDMKDAVNKLKDNHGINALLVEGGAGIFSTFLMTGNVDEIQLFIAPKILGHGLNSFGDVNINYLKDAYQFDVEFISESGGDIHVVLIKKKKEEDQ